MANGVYNNFIGRFAGFTSEWQNVSTVVKVLLLRDTGAYTFNPDHDVVNDILVGGGGVEISVASYSRQTVTSKTKSLSDVTDQLAYLHDNVAFGVLESGQTVEAVVWYEEVTDDTDSIPLLYYDGKIDIVAAAPVTTPTSGSITGATQANPCSITSASHGLTTGTKVRITGVGGMTELNGNVYTITSTGTNTFTLDGTDSSAYGAYTSGGAWKEVMNVYVQPLEAALADGTAVDFGGGATGNVNGATSADARKIEVYDLAAAITEGDTASDVATTINLPAALGGGNFNVNVTNLVEWFRSAL